MFSPVSAEPPDLADLSSHDAFVDGVPHRTFEHLRREDPVAWFDEPDASGFWALTRHADIVAVNRNYRQFSSRPGIRMEEMSEDERAARLTMMEQDPPEHTRLRRFVNRGFARPLSKSGVPKSGSPTLSLRTCSPAASLPAAILAMRAVPDSRARLILSLIFIPEPR